MALLGSKAKDELFFKLAGLVCAYFFLAGPRDWGLRLLHNSATAGYLP